MVVHPTHPSLLVSILEDHTNPDPADVVNSLCIIDTEKQEISNLVSGSDFYTSPAFSSDGTRIAWVQWSHPDMPWDGSEVHVASVSLKEDGSGLTISNPTHVAGKVLTISAGDPVWISNDHLLYTSDKTGYQNPYIFDVKTGKSTLILALGVNPDFVMGKIVVKNIYKCFILGIFLELNNTKKSKTLYSNICY